LVPQDCVFPWAVTTGVRQARQRHGHGKLTYEYPH